MSLLAHFYCLAFKSLISTSYFSSVRDSVVRDFCIKLILHFNPMFSLFYNFQLMSLSSLYRLLKYPLYQFQNWSFLLLCSLDGFLKAIPQIHVAFEFISSYLLKYLLQRFDYNVLTPFLPPKHEYVISVCLSELQVKLYQHYLENYSQKSDNNKAGSRLFQDWQALGRIWTHPRVIKMSADRESMKRVSYCNLFILLISCNPVNIHFLLGKYSKVFTWNFYMLSEHTLGFLS